MNQCAFEVKSGFYGAEGDQQQVIELYAHHGSQRLFLGKLAPSDRERIILSPRFFSGLSEDEVVDLQAGLMKSLKVNNQFRRAAETSLANAPVSLLRANVAAATHHATSTDARRAG